MKVFAPFLLFLALAPLSRQAAAEGIDETRLKRGRALFLENCAGCHGETGDGNGPAARSISQGPKPRNFIKGAFQYGEKPEELLETISRGVPGTAMPSWSFLPGADREALVLYVRSLKRK